MTESKLEAKTRQLAIIRKVLEALAHDDLIDQRIGNIARAALSEWDSAPEDKP